MTATPNRVPEITLPPSRQGLMGIAADLIPRVCIAGRSRSLLSGVRRWAHKRRVARGIGATARPVGCAERHCRLYGVDAEGSPTPPDAWVRMALAHRGFI